MNDVPAIRLSGLTRRMGNQLVLGGVDLEVAAGRLVVLRGGNGAGKTTLLKVLATRLRPTAGSAHLFGHDADYVGEMSFFQPDNETTFSELFKISENVHLGAMVVGVVIAVKLNPVVREPLTGARKTD